MTDTKKCPDCAETVLAEARKCRFCGYRFDLPKGARPGLFEGLLSGGQSAGGQRDGQGLFQGLLQSPRRNSSGGDFNSVLASWGVTLNDDGEEIEFFRIADVDGRPGFLLVTNERFVFFGRVSLREHEKWVEHQLIELDRVELVRRRLGLPDIRLIFGSDQLVVRDHGRRKDANRFFAYLSERAG